MSSAVGRRHKVAVEVRATPLAGRAKPPCCDTETGEPPVDPGLLDNC